MIPGYMYVVHTLARHGEHLHQHDNRHAQTRRGGKHWWPPAPTDCGPEHKEPTNHNVRVRSLTVRGDRGGRGGEKRGREGLIPKILRQIVTLSTIININIFSIDNKYLINNIIIPF